MKSTNKRELSELKSSHKEEMSKLRARQEEEERQAGKNWRKLNHVHEKLVNDLKKNAKNLHLQKHHHHHPARTIIPYENCNLKYAN